MIRKDTCIRMMTCQRVRPRSSRKKDSMARTAPSPSKTAPKARAASRIHMNMQVTFSVPRMHTSQMVRVQRPLMTATSDAMTAPTTEDSTRLT